MATRTSTQAKILCYPKSNIPYRYNDGFIVADILGDRMSLGGDNAGLSIQSINPTVSIPWLSSDKLQFQNIDNVSFVRFQSDGTFRYGGSPNDGTQSDLAGFILQGRVAPLDCKVYQGNTVTDGGNFDLNWVKQLGKWLTVLPPIQPLRNWIQNTGGDLYAKIRTKGTIQANRALSIQVVLSSLSNANVQPTVRIIWGDKYAWVGSHGSKWRIDRMVDGEWAIWKSLEDGPTVNASGGAYELSMRRIAGRLVGTVEGYAFWLPETKQVAGQKEGRNRNVDWQEAPLYLECYNIVAMVNVQLIKYSDANDEVFTGSFQRGFARQAVITDDLLVLKRPSGWSAPGCNVLVDTLVFTNQLSYTCTLTANLNGIDTPFVNKILIRGMPQWRRDTTNVLDIAKAVDKLTIDLAMPPEAPGAEANMVIDRTRLEKLLSNWEDFVDEDRLIDISIREHFDDGTNGDWVPMFAGYIVKPDKQTTAYNSRQMTVHALDPIWRLQDKNAKIDYKYPPLDFLFLQQTLELDQLQIWGSDCIKEILNIALGPFVGDTLNGDGNGEKYFNGHYPLLDTDSDTGGYLAVASAIGAQPPSKNGFHFMPPFRDDALGWMRQISGYDHGVFFWGKPQGWDGFPVPMYGRARNILASRPTYIIPDTVYNAGDQNKLLKSVSISTKPDKTFNAVQVWSNPPNSDSGGLLPALRMAEAILPGTDRNAPTESWKKLKIIEEPIGFMPGAAEAIAMIVINEKRGVDFIWPDFSFLGILDMQWGCKIQPHINGTFSDPDLTAKLNGNTYRAEKVQHQFDWTDGSTDDFITTAWTRPLTASGG